MTSQTCPPSEDQPATKPGIDTLNAGLGHLEITFNKDDPMEAVRAERIIADMLKRGYALFVQGTDGAMIRVKKFDEKHNAYVIADGPTVPAEAEPIEATPVEHRGKKQRLVKYNKTRTTSVGRSAGG